MQFADRDGDATAIWKLILSLKGKEEKATRGRHGVPIRKIMQMRKQGKLQQEY